MNTQEIVQELRRVRKAQRLSCGAVGLAMGRPAHVANPGSQISDWERGRVPPSLPALEAWAAALGLELALTLVVKSEVEVEPVVLDRSGDQGHRQPQGRHATVDGCGSQVASPSEVIHELALLDSGGLAQPTGVQPLDLEGGPKAEAD